ncbi:MAG: translocation/assembly module TamB domain-containing protein [Caulobacteraceae bacterium]
MAADPDRRRFPVVGALAVALAALAVLIGGLFVAVRYGPMTTAGRRMIENQVSGMKVGRFGRLEIEGLRGDVWRAFTVRRLTVADRRGVWLDARDLAVRWDVGALLDRRLRIASLAAKSVAVERRPELTPPTKPAPLPVSVDVDLATTRLETAPEFSNRRGLFDLRTAFSVQRSGGARGWLAAASALHAGDFLKVAFDLERGDGFSVDVDAREARGGALAGMAGLSADQPFLLTAHAKGALSAGRFAVITRVGAATPLEARGQWAKAGGSADGHIDLAASRLLAPYRAMVGREARFRLTGAKAADGFYALTLAADSDNIAVTARGEADVGRRATGPRGIALVARVTDPNRIVAVPKMGPAFLSGGLGGDAKHWVFNGAASVARVAIGNYALARLAGPIRVERRGQETTIDSSPAGQGGSGRGLAAALMGAGPRGAARLTVFGDGRLLVRSLDIEGAGLKVTAAGERTFLGGLSFKGAATVSNLAAALAGARGVVRGGWTASQASASKPWSFSFDARGERLATGLAEADRLLGSVPRLRVQANYQSGAVAIGRATLDGAAGSLVSAGLIGPAGALKLRPDWRAAGPLDIGPLEIDGAAKGSGALSGTFARPRADLMADFGAINLPVIPLRGAHLIVSFLSEPGGANGRFSLAGASEYGPARGSANFRFMRGGLDLSDVDVNGGGVTARGSVSALAGEPSKADLVLAVGPGALLSEGHAGGRVRIVDAPGGAGATLDLAASDAVLKQGGAAIQSLKLTAGGPLSRLPYRVSAAGAMAGGPWRLAGAGTMAEVAKAHVLSFAGTGRLARADFRTLAPAEIRFGPGRSSARLALAVGGGRADIDARLSGDALTAKAAMSNLSLGLVNEDLVGRFDGALTLAGEGARLTGALEAKLSGAGGRDMKGAPPVDGLVTARLQPDAIVVRATLGSARGLEARADVTLPAEASAAPFRIAIDRRRPLKGDFSIAGELKPIWDLTMGAAQSLSGRVIAAGTLGGSLADPRARGTASLEGGRFQDVGTGLKLDGVTLHATLADDAVDISRFSGSDGAKGTLTGSGRLSLAREGASSFRLDLDRFRLIDNDLAQASASGKVAVTRAADGKVKLSGALTVDRAQIAPNPPVATGVIPMDVVEIHKPFDAGERFAPAPARAAPIALDVGLRAPGGIFVKGRGLDVELSLDAHVGGTTTQPVLGGVARVVRGDYNFAGQRFLIDDRGVVYLGSSPETIRLDLTATRDNPTLTAVIRIQGTAAKPTITLTSTPVLPQDEVLSQVLFGASASQLSALQAAQLASAVSGLAGGGGFDIMGGLRNFAHLDRLAIGGTAATGTTVSGGKYLSDKVYLELTGGGREGPGAQVEWRVKKHLSVVSRLTGQGDSQLSVRWRKDY